MRIRFLFAIGLATTLLVPEIARAETGGCLKYGAAGAVAGHLAGHGVMGAVGGCAAGMYARHKARVEAERQRTEELNGASHRGGPDAVDEYRKNAQPLSDDADPRPISRRRW
jgi:hypothetical protein